MARGKQPYRGGRPAPRLPPGRPAPPLRPALRHRARPPLPRPWNHPPALSALSPTLDMRGLGLLACLLLCAGGAAGFRVAVVGAGVGGTATAYELRNLSGSGIDVDVYAVHFDT